MLQRLSKMLMAPESDTGNGGGGSQSTTTETSTEGQAQGQSTEKPVTVSDLTKLFTDFKNSTEANVRRMVEGAIGKKGKPAPVESNEVPTGNAVTRDELARLNTFNRKVGAIGASDEQVEILQVLLDVERPQDVSAWVETKAKALGISKREVEVANKDSSNNTVANRAPVTNTGGHAGAHKVTEDTPLLEMSESDRARLLREKGPIWYAEKLERDVKGRKFRIRD